ncbi:MAG TPA: arginase family protein [Gemmatimonadales bacterium]|nr:arginase family protein [Gemmatimonadales bacterium]
MNIQIFVVPYDSGRLRWRCGAGPGYLLSAGLTTHLHSQGHVVTDVQTLEDNPAYPSAEIRTAFELARRLAVAVRAAHAAGHFALVLSGNCNTAIGTLGGLTPAPSHVLVRCPRGLQYPETTTTGFLDGMGLAMATGLCWDRLVTTVPGFRPIRAEATFLLGARDLDPSEATLLRQSAVTVVEVGQIPAHLPDLFAHAQLADTIGYLHLDLDVLDPTVGHANYLPVPNGLSLAQLTGAITAIRAHVPLRAAALTSYSPEDDHDGGIARAAVVALDAILGSGA